MAGGWRKRLADKQNFPSRYLMVNEITPAASALGPLPHVRLLTFLLNPYTLSFTQNQ